MRLSITTIPVLTRRTEVNLTRIPDKYSVFIFISGSVLVKYFVRVDGVVMIGA
jgi:hypothetical protein